MQTVAVIPFYSDSSNNSMYTHDVSGTDNTAENNTAYGFAAMDAITTGDKNVAVGKGSLGALTTGEHNIGIGFNAADGFDMTVLSPVFPSITSIERYLSPFVFLLLVISFQLRL